MSLRPIDAWYDDKEEPVKSCLAFLRQHIISNFRSFNEAWKYGMPFFCCDGKMVCYLWIDKKTGWPYLGLVDGNRMNIPGLIAEKRARMKIWLIDPAAEIDTIKLKFILDTALALTTVKS